MAIIFKENTFILYTQLTAQIGTDRLQVEKGRHFNNKRMNVNQSHLIRRPIHGVRRRRYVSVTNTRKILSPLMGAQ